MLRLSLVIIILCMSGKSKKKPGKNPSVMGLKL